VHTASDGIEAHEFLFRRGVCGDACSPRLVLLDLNMPRKDGCELLAEVRQDARLRRQPVVVFSSSSSSEDIKRAYDSRANCYVTKPHDLDEFFAAIHRIEEFWLNLAQLPG
jgi:CheY-like chemotaxis protein